jgi:uncharacterized membrane protein
MKLNSGPIRIIILLLALAAIQFAYYYPKLPDTLAVHFGTSLEADGWQGKQGFVFAYACVEVGMVAMLLVIGFVMTRVPIGMVNIPNRDYWLAPERRKQTLECVMTQVGWIMVATLAYLIAIAQVILDANMRAGGRPPALSRDFWVIFIAFMALMAWFVVGIYRRFGKRPRHPDTGTAR